MLNIQQNAGKDSMQL